MDPVVRKQGPWPTTRGELKNAANSHMQKPAWKQMLQPQSILQMTAATTNIFITTS